MLSERDLLSAPFEPKYMSVRLAARELDVCELTVRRWLRKGLLQWVKFGRTIRIDRKSVYREKEIYHSMK
jgi:excisionase family DNA binding protein